MYCAQKSWSSRLQSTFSSPQAVKNVLNVALTYEDGADCAGIHRVKQESLLTLKTGFSTREDQFHWIPGTILHRKRSEVGHKH